MPRFFLFFLFLFAAGPLSAFQLADGTPGSAPPAAKYIFYWGKHQCDLTAGNGFKGQLKLTAPGFRQILLFPPTIWNGAALLRDFSFKLEEIPVSTADYTARLGELDAALGPKASVGAVFHITDLPLGNGIVGAVDILIHNPEDKKEYQPVRGNWASNMPFLNEQLLERVAWGREDITRISDRDFFTVAEFWQTVRQQPYAEWQPYAEPQTIRATINFQDPEQGWFGLSALLSDDIEYRQMLDNLNNYKHLARPGATVSLELQTAQQYERLYKKQMTLVPDNDTRLLLRRSRDTHTLSLEWGAFREHLEGLYLAHSAKPDGTTAPIDEPVARVAMLSYDPSIKTTMLTNPLLCRIDGESRSDLFFRITIAGDVFDMNAGEPFSDSIAAKIAAKCDQNTPLQLDSFTMTGMELPPLSFLIHFNSFRSPALVRNELEVLLKAASGNTSVTLFPPVLTDEEVQITFQLPKQTIVNVSIFDPDGSLVHLTEGGYSAGKHQVNVSRERVKSNGKYYVFLNTPFGVAKQEIGEK